MEEMIIVSSVSTVLLFMLKQWNDGFDSCMFHSSVIRVKTVCQHAEVSATLSPLGGM